MCAGERHFSGAPVLGKENNETIKLREDYIKLGQALKAAGFVESGVEAKYPIEDG